VSKVEIAQIIIGAKSLPEGATLKDIFEKLNEKFSYEKIKMAVVLSKE
jgi:hypothetical protein